VQVVKGMSARHVGHAIGMLIVSNLQIPQGLLVSAKN
jgi:hypothetical protein